MPSICEGEGGPGYRLLEIFIFFFSALTVSHASLPAVWLITVTPCHRWQFSWPK